jgi:hypothetical protein
VFYPSTSARETARGPYTVTFALSPSGHFRLGTNSMVTSTTCTVTNGYGTIGSIRILTAGTFAIQLSATAMTTFTSTATYTIKNYAYTLALSILPASPTVGFDFTASIVLDAEDASLFTRSCTVTLSEVGGATINGQPSNPTSTGNLALTVYFQVSGSLTLRATCPAEDSSPAVTVDLPITVQQPLIKITSFTAVTAI